MSVVDLAIPETLVAPWTDWARRATAGRRLLEAGTYALTEGAIAAGCRVFAGYPITPATDIAEYMSNESSPLAEPRWIEIGSERAVIVRDSKSADGRNALAWTIDTSEPIDWPLLEKDADHFYEQYDVKEIWVVNLSDKKKIGTVGDKGGYVRPGSHRTLSVAWEPPSDNGRRFALAAYQWKWGPDTFLLLDVGPDDSRSTQIGPMLDNATRGTN